MTSRARSRSWVLYAGLGVALVIIALLAWQHHRLREQYVRLEARLQAPPVGSHVPVLRAPSLAGDTLAVGAPDGNSRQLIVLFDTSCPHCRSTLPAWNELARHFENSDRISVMGIATDTRSAAAAYRDEHGLRFPVTTLPSRRYESLLRLNAVPLTLVVDSAGTVLYRRVGAITDSSAIDSVRGAAMREPDRSAVDSRNRST